MRIAFLGLGKMGSAVVSLLIKDQTDVVKVWNRSPQATAPLVELGAQAASTPAEAVENADVVFTMLLDDSALEDIMFQQGVLDALAKDAVHVSLSTISVALADRLDQAHAGRGQHLVSSPVFGRPAVAAEGKLWLAVAGADAAVERVRPLLTRFSRGITILGQRPSQANAANVAGNFLITSVIASLSETFTLAEKQGIAPALFLEMINSALFQSPFYANYGKLMIEPPADPGATVKLGAKDTKLFRAAAEASGVPTPLADLYAQHLSAAIDNGFGDEDWAAGYLAQSRKEVEAQAAP